VQNATHAGVGPAAPTVRIASPGIGDWGSARTDPAPAMADRTNAASPAAAKI
jgi:hypothetical protein